MLKKRRTQFESLIRWNLWKKSVFASVCDHSFILSQNNNWIRLLRSHTQLRSLSAATLSHRMSCFFILSLTQIVDGVQASSVKIESWSEEDQCVVSRVKLKLGCVTFSTPGPSYNRKHLLNYYCGASYNIVGEFSQVRVSIM